jgi:hypothetical protein
MPQTTDKDVNVPPAACNVIWSMTAQISTQDAIAL